jgi:hypothetical protein
MLPQLFPMNPPAKFLLTVAALLPCWAISAGAAEDAGLAVGRPLEPVVVRWTPAPTVNPLPSWALEPVDLSETAARFPVPASWQRPAFDRLILTVIFDDTEDEGPVVRWLRADGREPVSISEGLGESPSALGLHARTVVIPKELTDSGGRVEVALTNRPGGLRSASLQPARDVTLAVVGPGLHPSVIERSEAVLTSEEVDGQEPPPLSGDLRDGAILEAELVAPIEPFDTELEFVVPVAGDVEGGILHADVIGLEPGSRVMVEINGQEVGEMNIETFRLDDPAVTIDEDGFLTLAGWRKHSLFLPAAFWRNPENSIVLRLKNAPGPVVRQVSIKNVFLHLRFGEPVSTVLPSNTVDVSAPVSWEPDFLTPPVPIEEPPHLPTVITTPPRAEPPASDPPPPAEPAPEEMVLPLVIVTPPTLEPSAGPEDF